ncbi:MAG: glycosyltransferase family 2 protein [Bacteroidetes bacterium]|nr:glycosyltransferase family 2 protein [Bacteroidota bacterium]
MPELSVVITVLNEEENMQPLVQQLKKALEGMDYEVLFVNDGSTDGTPDEIRKHTNDRIRLLELDKNYGQSAAMRAGIEHSSGAYIAFLDGDLQNDPADIPRLLQQLKTEQAGMIAGNRKNRKDGLWLRKIPSGIANGLIRMLTGVQLKDYGCTLRVFQRPYAEGLRLYGKLHRFIPVLTALQGASIIQTDVQHHPRIHGKSKYGLGRTFTVLKDLLLITALQRFKKRPISGISPFGLICLVSGLIALLIHQWNTKPGASTGNDILYIAALTLLIAGVLMCLLRFYLRLAVIRHDVQAAKRPYGLK